MLRRYRLLDTAELVADGAAVSWGEVAADLGYAGRHPPLHRVVRLSRS